MADREFVFANPEVAGLIRERFVALAMDDWYLRRQQDGNGKFYMKMTEASPRGSAGDNTRQGRYVFTAAGKYLGFNNNRSPERILAMLRDALSKWEQLPDAERKPAGDIADVTPEPRYDRALPKGGAVVKVYTRVLEKKPDGKLGSIETRAEEGRFEHRGFDAAIDHLWLNARDLTALLPSKDAKPGTALPLPHNLAQRLARYHLTDNTRGEPAQWSKDEVKVIAFNVTPESTTRAKLSGSVHLETKDGQRGFTGALDGFMQYKDGRLTALRAVVSGDHWGDSTYTRGARPGKSPLGFAFQLITDPKPADSIPPQAARWLEGYYEPDRN